VRHVIPGWRWTSRPIRSLVLACFVGSMSASLVTGHPSSRDVRELVRDSWRRSLAAGVMPDQGGAPVHLAAGELERAQDVSPLAPAIGVIHSKLSSLDEDARHIVAVADAAGNLLWVTGDRGTPAATAPDKRVLTTADAELLSGWLAHPSGTDDLAAARALVAVLPCGDPRRAAATATAASIARRLSRPGA
jgi:hypothetical protein